ncbi:hypothetical protein Avbf_14411, partial [Armadillidium vulgare]
MKSEIEIKEEPFDIEEEEAANDELKRDCYGSIDVKSEIEIKEESFDFEEEETVNDKLLHKISTLDQNQHTEARVVCRTFYQQNYGGQGPCRIAGISGASSHIE